MLDDVNGHELLAVGELLEVGLDDLVDVDGLEPLVRELLAVVVVFVYHDRVDEMLNNGALGWPCGTSWRRRPSP